MNKRPFWFTLPVFGEVLPLVRFEGFTPLLQEVLFFSDTPLYEEKTPPKFFPLFPACFFFLKVNFSFFGLGIDPGRPLPPCLLKTRLPLLTPTPLYQIQKTPRPAPFPVSLGKSLLPFFRPVLPFQRFRATYIPPARLLPSRGSF